MAKQSKAAQYDVEKAQAQRTRLEQLQAKNFTGIAKYDEGLSSEEVKVLYKTNESFRNVVDTLNGFRQLTEEQQARFHAEANEGTKATLEADGYEPGQTQYLAPSLGEQEEDSAAQREASQRFLNTQGEAAVETQNEKLYEGVEIREGRYVLTIDPEDGTSPEVFRSKPIAEGGTQGEVWKLLRDSKKNATRELRRRAKKVQITKELREMKVDVIPYVPLEEKITLTPEQIFEATEQLKDPTTAIKASRLLYLASRTQEDIDRANEVIVRGRMQEQESAASTWIKNNPQFIVCDENLQAMMDIMGSLNWCVSDRNMTLAYNELMRQEALVTKLPEIPEQEFRTGPEPQQPRKFVPQSSPAERQAAPAPAARPVYRKPLNSSGGDFRSTRPNTTPVKPQPMTAAEYAAMPVTILQDRYKKEPDFKNRVDAYWAAGGR
jgi:hypothetical protein